MPSNRIVPSSAVNEKENPLDSWNSNANFWNESIGLDGNKYWNLLQKPCLDRLIAPCPGGRALDLATGNGLVARWLAERVDSVVATDGSEKMLENAASYNAGYGTDRISFQHLDVTRPEAFDKLLQTSQVADGFDIVVINMALMDIATLHPLADALPKLLKEDGIFVATMLHPVFFTSGAKRFVEVGNHPETGHTTVVRGKRIENYLDVPPWKGEASPDQPARQTYFHRPLHELFGIFFKRGLVMDAVEEPAFEEQDGIKSRVESHSNYTQIPAILSFRLRKRFA